MTLVAVGAGTPGELEAAVQAFEAAGFRTEPAFRDPAGADLLVTLGRGAEGTLREADAAGLRYQLVHVGEADPEPGGSHARAHHRVAAADLPGLAARLRSRDRLLVRILAFGYKHGLPGDADWVIDVRHLGNPYWVPALREHDGREPAVREHVLAQPAAADLLDRLVELFISVLPSHREQGRTAVTIAFGCTGGRHRSVVMAVELARRLGPALDAEVETGFREL